MEETEPNVKSQPIAPVQVVQQETVRHEAWSIGGWLGFFAIGLCFLPLRLIRDTYQSFVYAFSEEAISVYSTIRIDDLTYLPLTALVLWEVLVNLSFVAFSFGLIYIFFQRKKYFPKAFAIFSITNVVITVADALVANTITGESVDILTKDMIRQIFYTMIWVPYMFASKRAQNTFVL